MISLFNEDARFTFELPDSWVKVIDDDKLVYSFIKKQDGVGALQISLANKEKAYPPSEKDCFDYLNNHFRKQGMHIKVKVSKTQFGFYGYAEGLTKENRILASWIFTDSQHNAFVTYNCLAVLRDKELPEVKEIMNSFKLLH